MKNGHALLGMLATAIVAFQFGYILSAWSDFGRVPDGVGRPTNAHLLGHGPPLPADAPHDGTESTAAHHIVQDDIPVYWIEGDQDDFYERVYGDLKPLTHLRRNLTVKHYFPHVCGLYRFDTDRLPTVSVVVTLRNEQPDMVSLTVHSILARTPPSLLMEVIIVDDSDEKVTDELKKLKEVSKKVIVIPTTDREGCARSRIIGAKMATGTVLMFVDSHIEMLSSTWYEHLVLPIIENPHTVTSQQLQFLGDLPNHTYNDPTTRGSHYGITNEKFHFGYVSYRFPSTKHQERAPPSAPYEMPFAPGALFAIRRDEFWRLGAYDMGLYVWGAENMELSLKIWLCGGRLVQVPCSVTGHMYRTHDAHKWTNDNFTDMKVKLGIDGDEEGAFRLRDSKRNVGLMQRIWLRNNIRVAKLWLGNWRKYYYKEVFGSMELTGEWAKFEKEDQYMLEQKAKKKENHCRDIDWFDKHVYMRILGIHIPWYAAREQELNMSKAIKYGGKTNTSHKLMYGGKTQKVKE